jgi:hypothetical protein
LKDSTGFADRIESMLRRAMGISLDEKVEEEPIDEDISVKSEINEDPNIIDDDDDDLKPEKGTKPTTVY